MRQLLSYLLAFAAGMGLVAVLPGRGRRGKGGAHRPAWLHEHRLAVAVWVAGCLLTGTLAAIVASYMPLQ
jgi:hypothetical protein